MSIRDKKNKEPSLHQNLDETVDMVNDDVNEKTLDVPRTLDNLGDKSNDKHDDLRGKAHLDDKELDRNLQSNKDDAAKESHTQGQWYKESDEPVLNEPTLGDANPAKNGPNSHIVLDGGSIKGIEALLHDLVIERKKLRRKGWFTRILMVVFIGAALFMLFFKSSDMLDVGSHAAVVKLDGVIMAGGEINSDDTLTSLSKAFKSGSSKGVILQINSPGGSPVQSQEIYDGILRLKSQYDKPFYVVIGDVGASGGYYVAAAADTIYAAKASIIGSIGVRMDSFGVTGLMEKIGVESRTLTAGQYKAAMDPFSPSDPEVEKHLQKMIDGVHQQFINAVEQGRGNKLNGDKSMLYSGLFWNGEQSLDLGLIDGFKSTAQIAKEDLEVENVVDYTLEPDYLSLFAKNIGVSMANQFYRLFSDANLR